MIFNSFGFLFLFLPVSLMLFAFGRGAFKEWSLLGMSILFYGLAGIEHIIVLIGCMIWVWGWTVSQKSIGSVWRVLLSISGPLIALFYYKYLGFFIKEIFSFETLELLSPSITDKLLPAGISFYTFHLMSFSFDRYRGVLPKQPPLPHFLLYIAFFPHLVAGPILRYDEIKDGLAGLPSFKLGEACASKAISYFCLGIFIKVILADSLADPLKSLSAHPGNLSVLQSIYAVFGYSFQIYFDFWGYSLMAMGLAFLFGFTFPKNFNAPYLALNPQDFWRRWHMSLSRWFRDYLYIPLGGKDRYIRNTIIVFTICGFWHGAAWQFIVWGLYHGLLIVGYHLSRAWWDRCPRLMQQMVTFTLVSLGWILFQFDFANAKALSLSLIGQAPSVEAAPLDMSAWLMLAGAAGFCFFIKADNLLEPKKNTAFTSWAYSIGYALALGIAVIFLDRSESFIYFRF